MTWNLNLGRDLPIQTWIYSITKLESTVHDRKLIGVL